ARRRGHARTQGRPDRWRLYPSKLRRSSERFESCPVRSIARCRPHNTFPAHGSPLLLHGSLGRCALAAQNQETSDVIPDVRYAKTVDDVHVAYQVVGEGPIDLVYAPAF